MACTRKGGLKAKQTLVEIYGKEYFANIGRQGGLACVSKGFGKNPKLASEAGRKGGKISRRTK